MKISLALELSMKMRSGQAHLRASTLGVSRGHRCTLRASFSSGVAAAVKDTQRLSPGFLGNPENRDEIDRSYFYDKKLMRQPRMEPRGCVSRPLTVNNREASHWASRGRLGATLYRYGMISCTFSFSPRKKEFLNVFLSTRAHTLRGVTT